MFGCLWNLKAGNGIKAHDSLSVCLSVCMSVCLSLSLSLSLSVTDHVCQVVRAQSVGVKSAVSLQVVLLDHLQVGLPDDTPAKERDK